MKKHHTLDMDHNWKQTEIVFKSKPKVYSAGVIEEYIKERNHNWLNDNPPCSEELKQLIRDL